MSLACISASSFYKIRSYSYICQCLNRVLLCNFTFAGVHFRIQSHPDFPQDLLVDLICLLLCVACVHGHIHLVIHHFRVHLHFFRLLCEFPEHVSDLTHVHLLVDTSHYFIDSLQCVDHVLVYGRRAQLHLDCFELAAHNEVLINLLPGSHEIFRKNFCRTVLVLRCQNFDICKKFFLLALQLLLLAVDGSDGFLNLAFVLLGDFFGVYFRLFITHLIIN